MFWEPGALTSRDGGATPVLAGPSKTGGPTALDCIQAEKTDGRGDGELYKVDDESMSRIVAKELAFRKRMDRL